MFDRWTYFLEEELLEKAATIKIFGYFLLDKELNTPNDIVKDQYKLSKVQNMLLIVIEKMEVIQKKIGVVVKVILLKCLRQYWKIVAFS